MTIEAGALVRLDRDFGSVAGAAIDPSTVVLKLENPLGVVTTPAVTNDPAAVGAYYVDFTPTVAGVWEFTWYSTGDPQTVKSGLFRVRLPSVP